MKRLLHLAQKTWWLIPACILGVAILAAGGVILYKNHHKPTMVSEFAYECTKSNPNSMGCEQQKYARLTKSSGVAAAMSALKKDAATNPNAKNNCHQITHAIGRQAAILYGTVEKAYNNGDNYCWSGYYHGVMETLVRQIGAKKINDSLTTICADIAKSRPQSFYHFNCVHGLGHGLMSINDDQLFTALHLCDTFDDSWEQESCQGGVFMENIMASINPDDHTDYLKADQPMYPCTAVEDRYKQQCYLMQTSQALKLLSYNYAKVFDLCGQVGTYADTCYQSLGRDASGNSNSDAERTRQTCMLGPSQTAQANCFVGAVKDFISYFHGDTEATKLCNSLTSELQTTCIDTKIDYMKTL